MARKGSDEPLLIVIISGATGRTASEVLNASLAQFDQADVQILKKTHVRSSAAAVRASRTNLAVSPLPSASGLRNLSATDRCSRMSVARYTTAIPPSPILSTISYRPIVLPTILFVLRRGYPPGSVEDTPFIWTGRGRIGFPQTWTAAHLP